MKIYEILAEDIAWKSSLSKKIFALGYAPDSGHPTSQLWIPLTPGLLKRITSENPRETVFHVTGRKYVKSMLQGQRKKRSISAFFKMDHWNLIYGIQGGGGFIFELDAEILGAFDQDVMSAPDESGRRWITLHYLVLASEGKLEVLYTEMHQLIDKLYIQYHSRDPNFNPDDHTDTPEWASVKRWETLGNDLAKAGDNQALYHLIKGYIDGVYAIFQRHSDVVLESLRNYLTHRRTQEDWDEIVVNNYKILQVHVVDSATQGSSEDQDAVKYLKDNNIPIKVWDSYAALGKYTTSVAAK